MKSRNLFLFGVIEELGKKWVMPVIVFLFNYGRTSFSVIKKRLKLTSGILSKRLKLLETLGIVEKITIDNTKKGYYKLSETGECVAKIFMQMGNYFSEFECLKNERKKEDIT